MHLICNCLCRDISYYAWRCQRSTDIPSVLTLPLQGQVSKSKVSVVWAFQLVFTVMKLSRKKNLTKKKTELCMLTGLCVCIDISACSCLPFHSFAQNESSVIIYSPSYHSKPILISFFNGMQKAYFWKISCTLFSI